MKSHTLTAIKTPLELIDREPLSPAAGEVIVDLKAAAMNRRDYWITQGMYPGIECPVVLGSDGAGVVSGIGSSLGNYWQDREVIINPGWSWGGNDRVQSDDFSILGMPQDGTFSQQVAVSAEALHEKPSHLSWAEAAALPLAGVTAYRALFTQGKLSSGENVLINGIGGGVATYALSFAIAAGANVWVTSSSEEKIARAVQLGAKGGANYRAERWWKSFDGPAPNLIIDSAGGAGYNTLLSLAAPAGRVVNYGATAGPPEKVDLFKVFWKQLTVQGTTMGSPSDFASMLSFLTEHRVHPVVDQVFAFDEANAAIESMETSPQFGKIVLDIAS